MPKFIDLIGQRFGRLVVIEKTNKRDSSRRVVWRCQCDCGNIKDVSSVCLIEHKVMSCGCLLKEKQEQHRKILEKVSIKFQTHYSFSDCKDINTLPFDFFVNGKYLIEYDGIQHFIATNKGWNTDAHFALVQRHDFIKNNYCKINNIPLIRIPYTHYNDICLEDLILDTTTFLINKETNK